MRSYTLHNSAVLPIYGYGTRTNEHLDYTTAIQQGLRHFLIPFDIEEQRHLKTALQNSGLTRDEFFLSAIVTHEDTLPVHHEFDLLLKTMDTDYIDCLLTGWHSANTSIFNDPSRMIPVWSTMENIYKQGDTRVIGIHDMTPLQLEALLHIVHIAPIVALMDAAQLSFASLKANQEHNIQPILYLSKGQIDLEDEKLRLLAKNHGTDVQSILQAWLLEKNCALLSNERLKETALKLKNEEQLMLDALAES